MGEDIKGPDFTIKDHRASQKSDDEAKADDEKKSVDESKKKKQVPAEEKTTPPFEMNFSTFVMSLTSSAFYYLGDMADPETGKTQENLPAVKQTIDILIMLQEKTKNNLEAEEGKLLEQLIYELQMKFVAKQKK